MIAPLFATPAHQRAYVHTPNKKVRTASVCATCLGTLVQPRHSRSPQCSLHARWLKGGEGSGCKDEVLARLKYAVQSASRGIMPCEAHRPEPPLRAEGLCICARDMR